MVLAIGAGKGIELSPLEVATAYTIFPNNGLKVWPRSVWAVYNGDPKLEIAEKKAVTVVDTGAAFTLTQMLQSVIGDGPDGQYGTASMARKLSALEPTVALAGKTGVCVGLNDVTVMRRDRRPVFLELKYMSHPPATQ